MKELESRHANMGLHWTLSVWCLLVFLGKTYYYTGFWQTIGYFSSPIYTLYNWNVFASIAQQKSAHTHHCLSGLYMARISDGVLVTYKNTILEAGIEKFREIDIKLEFSKYYNKKNVKTEIIVMVGTGKKRDCVCMWRIMEVQINICLDVVVVACGAPIRW